MVLLLKFQQIILLPVDVSEKLLDEWQIVKTQISLMLTFVQFSRSLQDLDYKNKSCVTPSMKLTFLLLFHGQIIVMGNKPSRLPLSS